VPELNETQRRQLEALRREYEAELPEKVTLIARAVSALGLRAWSSGELQELHHLVHRLAGSSAIWGFTALSKAAGDLEVLVLSALDGSRASTPELSGEVRRLLDLLQHAVPNACPGPRVSEK
jgi:HPt (histidine-containing phosphotransfer) domain-containing protein